MTKEAILEHWFPTPEGSEETQHILKAMSDYAKQQAIAFSEWNLKEGRIMFENRIKTTEELYTQFIDNQFIEQQNKP